MTIMNRRAVLRGIASTATATAALAVPTIASASTDPEPVIAAWRAWRALEMEFLGLARLEREKWAALPDWVRAPKVLLMVGKPSGREFFASYPEEIEQHFFHPASAFFPSTPAQLEAKKARRDAKLAELEDIQRRASQEQERCGLRAIEKRLDELVEAQDGLERLIEESPSMSPVSLAAKVDVGFSHSEKDESLVDLPHCMFAAIVRSIIHELPADMVEALAPIAAGEGTIREIYTRPAAAQGAV